MALAMLVAHENAPGKPSSRKILQAIWMP